MPSDSLSPSFMASITSALPTPTPPPGNNNNNNGPTSSPLLFFVALGFGVVFTNLWIIVGVKYCFRYNARQRARANGEEETVDLQTMPRPHRRRREKKLMSQEEVDERFPATKYKSWRAHRERMGLPSEGGIKTAPNSRPGSVKQLEAAITPIGESSTSPADANALLKEVLGSSAAGAETSSSAPTALAKETLTPTSVPEISASESKRLSDISDIDRQKDSDGDEEEEEEHIHTAVPDELLNTTGDTCAICIDVIEDDDEIRGLTCGHAFHVGCLDPWLISRRACCPLCKADYYTPKPRPEAESNTDENGGPRSRPRREPTIPPEVFIGPPFHRRMIFSSGRFTSPYYGSAQTRTTNSNSGPPTTVQTGSGTTGNRWLRNPFRRGGGIAEEPTPGALEAGGDRAPTPSQLPTPSPMQGIGTH